MPELRGLLLPPPANAPSGVVAVLQSTSGARAPCSLRASDDAVAGDILTFAAKGAVVIVTGKPGEFDFTVTGVRADGRRRAADEDAADVDELAVDVWSHVTWRSVPAREK